MVIKKFKLLICNVRIGKWKYKSPLNIKFIDVNIIKNAWRLVVKIKKTNAVINKLLKMSVWIITPKNKILKIKIKWLAD
jgi:hypothetical protein